MKPFTLASIAALSLAFAINHPGQVRGDDDEKAPEHELVEIEHDWNDAIIRRDETILARILADDYILTTPFGQVVSKEQMLESLRTHRGDAFEMKAIDQDQFSSQVYGDTAIVHSRFVLKGRVGDKAIKSPYRHTDVFVKKNGRWRCVSRQATTIVEPASPSTPALTASRRR